MKNISLTPDLKKFKSALNIDEKYIFKKKINKIKNEINQLFITFETDEERSMKKKLKIKLLNPKRASLKSRRISSYSINDNLNMNLIKHMTERKKCKKTLYDKIKFGSLEYLNYVDENHSSKKFLVQKDMFLNSKNFDFGKSNNISYSNNFLRTTNSYKLKDKNNQSQRSKRNLSNDIPIIPFNLQKSENKTSSTFYFSNNNENNIEISEILEKDNNLKKNISNTTNTNNNINNNNSQNKFVSRNLRKNKFLLSKNKNMNMSLLKDKVKKNIINFDKNIKKNKEELIKFIHSTEKKKKINSDFDILKNDMNELLGVNKKQKSNSLEITGIMGKNGLVNAINSNKAKMILLSDRINKMSDEEAINFVGNIEKEYKEESKNVGIGFLVFEDGNTIDLNNRKQENRIIQMIRKKLSFNSKKIKRMRFKVDFENTRLSKRKIPESN